MSTRHLDDDRRREIMQEILALIPDAEPSIDEFTSRQVIDLAAVQNKRVSPCKVRRVLKELCDMGCLTRREVIVHASGRGCRAYAYKLANDDISLADVVIELGMI